MKYVSVYDIYCNRSNNSDRNGNDNTNSKHYCYLSYFIQYLFFTPFSIMNIVRVVLE